MARTALPKSRLKLRKRRRRLRIGLLIAACCLLLAAGLVFLFHAPFWRISQVTVEGTQSVAPQAVVSHVQQFLAGSYLYVFPKDAILLYPKRPLMASLTTRFSAFSEVTVTRKGLTSLTVNVSEYGPYVLWCGESSNAAAPCLLMDKDGVAYAPAVSFAGSAYVRYYGVLAGTALPRHYLTPEQFHALDALLLQISQNASVLLTSVSVDATGDARAEFANGFTLIFSLKDTSSAQIYQYFQLAQTAGPFKDRALDDFEYLDLRFGDKLYYKLKGE